MTLRTDPWNRPLPALLASFVIGMVILTVFPRLDLWIAGWFYLGEGRFWLYRTPAGNATNDARDLIGFTALGVTIACMLFMSCLAGNPGKVTWRHAAAPMLTFLVAVVIIANAILKSFWGRARPRQVLEFGGQDSFTGALILPGPCQSNCSFVTGDGAFAFAFVSFALLAIGSRRKLVVWALLFGLMTGLVRMMAGAHYLSDVLYAGLVSVTVASLVHWLVFREGPAAILGLPGDRA